MVKPPSSRAGRLPWAKASSDAWRDELGKDAALRHPDDATLDAWLRQALGYAYGTVLREPVPARLLRSVKRKATPGGDG